MTTANKFNELPENNHQNRFSINKPIFATGGQGLQPENKRFARGKNGPEEKTQNQLQTKTAALSYSRRFVVDGNFQNNHPHFIY